MSGTEDFEEPGQPATAPQDESGSASRPSQTNCVTHDDGGESVVTPIDESRPTTPLDRVEEFREEYPYLAGMPITEQHGRSLRREATDAQHVPEYVEPEREWENGFVTYKLRERTAASFADVLFAFLDSHQRYEQGMKIRFSGVDETGEEAEFEVDLEDSWGEPYAKREYARAMALERQLAGGEHPDGTAVDGEWNNILTIMLTLTGSSVPNDNRLAPVDQFDPVSDSWSYGGVRHTVRNICENDLGLESHEWGFLRFAEPHGVGSSTDPEKTPGKNACYSHTHVGLYLDLDLDTVPGGEDRVRDLFHDKAIGKHLEACEIAGREAHTPDKSVSINSDVANMGSYLSAYMCTFSAEGPDDDGEERPEYVPLIERPIEYVAWGSIMWAMNRQRIGRSRILNEAISADQCQAQYRSSEHVQEHDHGERLAYRGSGYGSKVVCAECGSGWGIDADAETVSEIRLEAERKQEQEHDAGRSGRHRADGDRDCGDHDGIGDDLRRELEESECTEWARYGESPAKARVRSEVEDYIKTHGRDTTVPELLGKLSINPDHVDVVEEALNGVNSAAQVDSWSADEEVELPSWEVDAFIDENGDEHRASSGGGVEMVDTYMPIKNVQNSTRLRYISDPDVPSAKIRCRRCNCSMYNPTSMAGHLVHKHDIEEPCFADHLLKFETYSGELPEQYHEPVSPIS